MGSTSQFLMFLIALSSTGNSALFVPNAYTLTGVVAVNGSNVNGDCPSECVGISVGIKNCNCDGTTRVGEDGITGVLIDDTVPAIDPAMRNDWGSQLFTVMGGPSGSNITIGVRFSSGVALREVIIYLFHCHAWGIGAEAIHVHYSGSFPGFVRIFDSLGSVTLTSDMQNCDSLTRVSIPIQPALSLPNYFLEFYNPSRLDLQWVHIGEVTFSDQPVAVPTTMGPTTTPTTMEATTDGVSTTPTISTSVTNESTTDSTSPSSTTGDIFMLPITTDTTTENSQTTTPGLPLKTPDITDQATSTPDTQSPSAAVVGALVGVIVVLLVLLTIGGVVFTAVIWRIKTRAMVREDGNREYDDVVHGSEMIETKANEAYGQVTGVGGARGGALRMDMGTGEGEYEEIKDISYRNA